jgi:hypothetical protein
MAGASTGLGSLLKQLPLWWHNQLAAMRALDEINRSPGAELVRTAGDCGITVQRLRRVAARGPLSMRLMEMMARTYGLEPAALRRADLNTIREMEERCTFCRARFRCAIDLGDDDGIARAQAYCPNADIFEKLREGIFHSAKS